MNKPFYYFYFFTFFFIPSITHFFGQEVSFLFMGDIMGHGPQINAAYDKTKKRYDYSGVFNPLEGIISSVDFAIANLEVTLAGQPYMGYPQFSSPDELAVACKNVGIDVLVTANNHSCDRKNSGLIRTVEVLDSLNILHTGTFKNKKNREKDNLLILSKEGIKVGLLNYTYGTNGIPFSYPAYVNLLDSNLIKNDISNANSKELDKLIVFVHWGYEYKDFPNSFQKKFNNYFYELGVDVVIGSHPHVLQPMIYKNYHGREFLTVFSLGNFVSNQRDPRKDGGAMLRLSFEKKGQNIKISRKEYLLTWVHKFLKNNQYYYEILPCSKNTYNKDYFSNKEDFISMKKFLNDSRKHLNNNNLEIEEGIPYGYAKRLPVFIDQNRLPKIRKILFSSINTKKRKKRKK
ncbi:MAG: capsule biosynthesis protein CapA [Crocinitomicaceae bacterium]|nr:capsule biosynthesis protein CapA [Crocinitomicaceae bacterium]